MQYQIDQSIKIEDTSRPSYVAVSNGKNIVAVLPSCEKRKLKNYFRKIKKPLIFKLFCFSTLCAKVIIESKVKDVEIDYEYIGQDATIGNFISSILCKEDAKVPFITFGRVGKSSKAHLSAYHAYKTGKGDFVLSAKDIIKWYEK